VGCYIQRDDRLIMMAWACSVFRQLHCGWPAGAECSESVFSLVMNVLARILARPMAAPAPPAPPFPLMRRMLNAAAAAALPDYQCMPNVVWYGAVVSVAGAIFVISRSFSGNTRRELAPWNAAIVTLILSSVVNGGPFTLPVVLAFWFLCTVVFHDIATVTAGISQIYLAIIGGVSQIYQTIIAGVSQIWLQFIGLGKDALKRLDEHVTNTVVALSSIFLDISSTCSQVVSAVWTHSTPSNILQIVFAAVMVAYAPRVGHAMQQFLGHGTGAAVALQVGHVAGAGSTESFVSDSDIVILE
jgi:hypothetical protein